MNKKEVRLDDADVSRAHQEIIQADQEQNRSRAETSLAILPEAAQKNIQLACGYSSYFPNPITKPFMRKYILAKLEFPTKGSELAQSLTELNVRIDTLFTDAYSFEKAKLESEELDLEMQELTMAMEQEKDELKRAKLDVKIRLKGLEVTNKRHSLNKIKLAAMSRYNEAMAWKGCVEDIMGEMEVKSLDEVDFNSIRMDEMAGKIRLWGELQAKGALDMTPTKLQAIASNEEAFASGFFEGQQKIEEAQKLLALHNKPQS